MKITCKKRCQFRGLIIHVGEMVEVQDGEITPQIRNSFDIPQDGAKEISTPSVEDDKPKDKSMLPKEEVERRLDEMGVAHVGLGYRELWKLYKAQFNRPDIDLEK